MEILYVLLVLLLVPRVFGEVAARVGQPPRFGGLLAGIALGATAPVYADAFPALSGLIEDPAFAALSDLECGGVGAGGGRGRAAMAFRRPRERTRKARGAARRGIHRCGAS